MDLKKEGTRVITVMTPEEFKEYLKLMPENVILHVTFEKKGSE